MSSRISVDLIGGFMRAAGYALPIVAVPGRAGWVQLGTGRVLRPLTFQDRFRVVRGAATATDPVDQLCAAVLEAATATPPRQDSSGADDRYATEILALYLAGADRPAPSFGDTLLSLAAHTGWSLPDIERADAAHVDHLAGHVARVEADEWQHIVFESGGEEGLSALCAEYAGNLLRRMHGHNGTDAVADPTRPGTMRDPGPILPDRPEVEAADGGNGHRVSRGRQAPGSDVGAAGALSAEPPADPTPGSPGSRARARSARGPQEDSGVASTSWGDALPSRRAKRGAEENGVAAAHVGSTLFQRAGPGPAGIAFPSGGRGQIRDAWLGGDAGWWSGRVATYRTAAHAPALAAENRLAAAAPPDPGVFSSYNPASAEDSTEEMADAISWLLHEQADLRGLDP